MTRSTTARALTSGAAGALALTGLHEAARHLVPHAPRMDVIGERALKRTLAATGRRAPRREKLFRSTLAGELVSNTLYYSLAGTGSGASLLRGLVLGLAAGVGAVLLPPRLGLGDPPGERKPLTPMLTTAWYTAGGLAAAAVARLLEDSEATTSDEQDWAAS